jgi:hypothetical protein
MMEHAMQNTIQSNECIKTKINTFFNQNQNSHFVQQAMKLKITEHKIDIELDLDEQITNISDKMKAAIDALNKQRFEILDKQEKSRLLSLIKNKFDETEKSLRKNKTHYNVQELRPNPSILKLFR